ADIAKALPGRQQAPVFGKPAETLTPYKQAQMEAHAGGYFIRMRVQDKPGVFATIASAMAANRISLESIVQRSSKAAAGEPNAQPAKTVILITHTTTEAAIRKATDVILQKGELISKPQIIRIERT
ncbi:MAG: ACT domain-containing protein, partial [Pseudomonadota bacterium]